MIEIVGMLIIVFVNLKRRGIIYFWWWFDEWVVVNGINIFVCLLLSVLSIWYVIMVNDWNLVWVILWSRVWLVNLGFCLKFICIML